MSFNSTTMIPELRAEFEKVLALLTSPEAQTATLDQMERTLLGQVLRLGGRLLQAFADQRSAAEIHRPYRQGRKTWPYHSQETVDYRSVFGPLVVVVAFGFDERTVQAWHKRAGQHCQQVQAHVVQQPRDLGQVQADELWVKLQGVKVRMALAIQVSSRLPFALRLPCYSTL
jgi:hypothetical protein